MGILGKERGIIGNVKIIKEIKRRERKNDRKYIEVIYIINK